MLFGTSIYLPTQVILGLYIGNYRDSKDIEQLTENGITHIIAIHDTARRLFPVSIIYISDNRCLIS